MNDSSTDPKSSINALLSKMSRYEALLELTGVVNAATDIESVGMELARRLKYIADIYAWRYICFEGDPEESKQQPLSSTGFEVVQMSSGQPQPRCQVSKWSCGTAARRTCSVAKR